MCKTKGWSNTVMNVATFLQILASTAFHNLGTVCGCFTFEKTSSRPTVPPCYLTWSSSAFIWRNVWFVHCSQHYVLVVQTWPPFLLRNSSPWTQNGFGNPPKKNIDLKILLLTYSSQAALFFAEAISVPSSTPWHVRARQQGQGCVGCGSRSLYTAACLQHS